MSIPVMSIPADEYTGRPLLCVCGPTGAGKSAAALFLASRLNGVIINCDSRQIYADFPLITAQPSAQEKARCPHLLYGFAATDETLSVASYAQRALAAITRTYKQGKLPVLVGGTGMYCRAVLRPLAAIPPVPATIRRAVQKHCEEKGPGPLHTQLARVDPELASRLHPNDKQRIMRGLEVFEATGVPLSRYQQHTPPKRGFHALLLGVGMPLKELTPLLYRRIDSMLASGAMEEAQRAMHSNSDPSAAGWSGIGCAELLAFLQGRLDKSTCVQQWRKNTRSYAKRQLTWFRADTGITWYNPQNYTPATKHAMYESMLCYAQQFFTPPGST